MRTTSKSQRSLPRASSPGSTTRSLLCSARCLTFDSSAKTVADLVGVRKAVQTIMGRRFVDGNALGLPVAFQKVAAGPEYQIVVAQDVGDNNPNLLCFIDVNADDSPITVERTGTLIIRPVLLSEPPSELPPTIGVWMRLST